MLCRAEKKRFDQSRNERFLTHPQAPALPCEARLKTKTYRSDAMPTPVESAPTPLAAPSEAQRVAALHSYDILDTAREVAFDDIAQLAAMLCDVPMAAVSFVDSDRQWFKAKVGLQYTQLPRTDSFCAHAMGPHQVTNQSTVQTPVQGTASAGLPLNVKSELCAVLVVLDASLDERFSANSQVTGDPRVRFYAGAPIVTPSGEALGTVCVFDSVPRELGHSLVGALQALARHAMVLLELRRIKNQPGYLNADPTQLRLELDAVQKRLDDAQLLSSRLCMVDQLTGLENRRAFDRVLNEEASRTERSHSPLSLALIDIDNFKAFNDQFGGAAGDMALQQLAMLLGTQARTYDHVARFGGEEFAIVLPDTSVQAAQVVTERVRVAVESFRWDRTPLTVSIGFATMSNVADGQTILERADRALYQAKHQGRNRVVHIGDVA